MARKILTKTVSIEGTPKSMRIILEVLWVLLNNNSSQNENPKILTGGALHGGIAKAMLGWILEQEQKVKVSTALKIFLESRTDVDLIMFANDIRNINLTEQKFKEWREKLAVNKIQLKPDDVAVIPERTALEVLKDNDLTINEVFAIPSGIGTFTVYYTDICERDTISEVAILTSSGRMTTRMHNGERIPSHLGFFRLISAYLKGRVKAMYIPEHWINLNNAEAIRLKIENFGVYGLLLAERVGEDTKKQREMMRLLNDLNFTDIKDFAIFKQEQELLFLHRTNGEKFMFDKNRTFRQIQEHLFQKEVEGKKAKATRDGARSTCTHQTEVLTCNDCRNRCKIVRCTKCTLVQVTPLRSKVFVDLNTLECNRNMFNSNVYWDERGFYS